MKSSGGSITGFIRSIFGTYTPTDPTSLAGADWEYILSFILFIMVTYCVLRMIGSLFKR